MKTKHIIFTWVYPLIAILLFVASMFFLIHEGAFHNGQRKTEVTWAMFAVLISFLNGIVSIVVSGAVTKPKEKNYGTGIAKTVDLQDVKDGIDKIWSDNFHPVKIKYMKRGVCNDCGNRIAPEEMFCEICINTGCKEHDTLDCENSNEKR